MEWDKEFSRETLSFLPCKFFFWSKLISSLLLKKQGSSLFPPPPPPPPHTHTHTHPWGGGALVENTALTRIDKSNKHNSNFLRQLATKIHLLVPLIS